MIKYFPIILLLFSSILLAIKSTNSGTSSNGKILIVLAPNAKSHFLSAWPFIQRLISDGHHLHFLNIFDISDENKTAENAFAHQKFTFIPIRLSKTELANGNAEQTKIFVQRLIWNKTMHSPHLASVYWERAQTFTKLVENHAETFKSVLNAKWDLVIIGELFNLAGYSIANSLLQYSHIPYALLCTSTLPGSTAYFRALGHSWVANLHRFSPTPSHPFDGFQPNKFTHRLANVIENLLDLGSAEYIDRIAVAPKLTQLMGSGGFTFAKLHSKSAATFMDTISNLGFPQPIGGNLLNVGAHCEQIRPLEMEFKNFVENPASKGTIYIAFGTFISLNHSPPNFLNAFFDAFKHFPEYRFVFSSPNKNLAPSSISSNILLAKWAPQANLLGHQKTKLFITHCGLKSIREAICTQTPMLAMPMYAEQNYNAKLVYEYGLALLLNKFSVDANSLRLSIHQLLNNSSFAERAKKLRRIFLDAPEKAHNKFAFQVRKILEKKGGKGQQQFKDIKGCELNFIPHFCLDFGSIIFLLILFIFD